jgi:bifunctional non-homologous end joining protein LigD
MVMPLKKRKKKPIFVIQQHHATHMHFDFRLEINGVLVSWALPKGPSMDPNVKRLAILTTNHHIAYADFEGIITRGYGAGTVIVWDKGTFKNNSSSKNKKVSIAKAFKEGHIEITLEGKKLKGKFTLIRISPIKKWIFFKIKDRYSQQHDPVSDQPESVLSGKTMQQLDKKLKAAKNKILEWMKSDNTDH